jgi:hypothetical protein
MESLGSLLLIKDGITVLPGVVKLWVKSPIPTRARSLRYSSSLMEEELSEIGALDMDAACTANTLEPATLVVKYVMLTRTINNNIPTPIYTCTFFMVSPILV